MQSFKVLLAIKDDPGLTSTEKLVLYTIALHHNPKTGQCNPGQTLIARECGLSREAVNRAIKSLIESGKLSAIRTKNSSQYSIKMCSTITSDVTHDHIKYSSKYTRKKIDRQPTDNGNPIEVKLIQPWEFAKETGELNISASTP